MLSPWIIRTLTLPPLLASPVPCNSRRYRTPPYTFLEAATIPTYYGISIAILRYIAMQLSTFPFYYDTFHLCHIAMHDHVVDIVFVAKPPCLIVHTCHS